MAYYRGSTTPLVAEEEWISQVGLRERHDTLAGSVIADQGGTAYVEQSSDGENWDLSKELTLEAEKAAEINEILLLPYWRVRVSNTSEDDQKVLRVSVTTQAGGDS